MHIIDNDISHTGPKARPSTFPTKPETTTEPTGIKIQEQGKGQVADAEPPSESQVIDTRPMYTTFTTWQKRGIVLGAAAGAFFSPLSGQIYFPALNLLSKDLNVTADQINLTVTTYMIFQGITPMFVGTFADAIGRRPAYFFCFIVYLAANIGCALAPNYAALLVFRMLQSAGASTTVSLCQAVMSDIVTSAERGQYVGWISLPIVLAPSLGPVLGGIFSQYLGWRWIFWFLTIISGFVFIIYALFMPETCRNIVGDGSIRPYPYYRTFWQLAKDAIRKRRATKRAQDTPFQPTISRVSTSQSFHMKRPNIFQSLVILFEKEMFLLLFYSSFIYAGFYAVATAMSSQFAEIYGFNDLLIGLMYLPLGGGSIVAAFTMGKLSNWNYRRHCKKLNIPFDRLRQQDLTSFPIEKARLQIGGRSLVLFALVLVGWGWALEYRAPLAVPIVLLFLIGISLVGFTNTANTLIVDINPGYAASATAANNLTRCLIGAAATAVISPMISGIGPGWSFTIFSLIYVTFSPVLWLIMKNGVKWRKVKLDKREKREQQEQRKESEVVAG